MSFRLTPEAIALRVREIRREAARRDYETAHTLQDNLFEDLLLAISRGEVDDPKAAADAALEATKIDFPRWAA